MRRNSQVLSAAAMAALAMTASANAAAFLELEGNDSKATANVVALVAPGDTIVGNSQGTSTTVAGATSADYFRVSTPAQPIGVYRNRLVLTTSGTAGHAGTIRGLGQTATGPNSVGPGLPNAAAPDNTIQTSSTTSTPPRFNQWYSFGGAGSHYYRVTGSSTTTADYTATWEQTPVTPTNLGTVREGSFELTNTQLSSTVDSDIIVYNATTGLPVPGFLNDDFLDGTVTQTSGSTLNSRMIRTFTPGTYLIAISDFNTADFQLSPTDEGTATASVMDFPGAMANSSTTLRPTFPFRIITPLDGTIDFSAAKAGIFDIQFFSLTVTPVPEPTSLAAVGLAGLGLAARRRRRA